MKYYLFIFNVLVFLFRILTMGQSKPPNPKLRRIFNKLEQVLNTVLSKMSKASVKRIKHVAC